MENLLFHRNVNITRRAYIWNLISSVSFSIQSALFLLVVTRAGGEIEAGSFIILFTIAQTLSTVGNYNLRDFQVSDLKREFSFSDYFSTRIVTCLVMTLLSLAYAFWKHLDAGSLAVLLSLILYRFVECVEDVFHGDIQKSGRFDVATICMSARIIAASVVFCAVYILTKNQVVSSLLLLLVSLAVFLWLTAVIRRHFDSLTITFDLHQLKNILLTCFPVFAGAFLYSYLINAPKYAIDDLLSKESQTIYNILFMPVFFINILSMFIYKPQLVHLSELWKTRDIRGFRSQILKQIALILVLTGLIMLGGYFIGLKLLSLIYGVELSEYRMIFVLLLLFGGFTAVMYYLNTLITVIRKQVFIVIGYGLAFIINLFVTSRLVSAYGIRGAGYAYGIIMTFLMLYCSVVVFRQLAKAKETEISTNSPAE